MGKPHPMELRERVVAFVEEGNTHRSAAAHFRVSIKFVNDMVKLKRETGSLAPKPQGNGGWSKLGPYDDWARRRLAERSDLTLEGLARALRDEHGLRVAVSLIGYWLHRLGLSHKKTLRAAEQSRPEVARERALWINRRQPFMVDFLHRLAFIDETSLKTNMIKKTGWAPRGERLIDHAPHGHWNTQTFIAALRHDRLDAPWILKGAMDRGMFDLYIETQLAPTLHKGDVVILDNLPVHKSPKSQALLKEQGSWFLFLPRYSPDLNPIEMAFAKLKALIRKAAARTYDDLWQAVGHVCDLFTDEECFNFFKAAGYEPS
ncbi:MAG: IS630 family transposase [Rhodospirillaceae bacterium]|nr:IS630 family transposase [Rhodospirillaceae bacterium]